MAGLLAFQEIGDEFGKLFGCCWKEKWLAFWITANCAFGKASL